METSNRFGTYTASRPATIDLPIVTLECQKLTYIPPNQRVLLFLKVSGSSGLFEGKHSIDLVASNNKIILSTVNFQAEKGWIIQTHIECSESLNGSIQVKIDGKNSNVINLSFRNSTSKDVFYETAVKRLLDDYDRSVLFNQTGAVIGNGYCITSADKGIGALLNDSKNFYSEPNLKSQGGNGIRTVSSTQRAAVFKSLGYVDSEITIRSNNYNTESQPTRLETSLKSAIEVQMINKIGYHVYYFSMHGEYHVLTLLINNINPCKVTYSILDQGYVGEKNLDFEAIDSKFLELLQKFWSNKPKHAKNILMWKIKTK
jgi:hypothetical protein